MDKKIMKVLPGKKTIINIQEKFNRDFAAGLEVTAKCLGICGRRPGNPGFESLFEKALFGPWVFLVVLQSTAKFGFNQE
ncbi:MAG: hypothetical protein H3C64_06440 [Candidatus Kuenenia stuttgartiensis]|nr:hypothetical protein [Candidatus Kuenenia stuttgartiensis]